MIGLYSFLLAIVLCVTIAKAGEFEGAMSENSKKGFFAGLTRAHEGDVPNRACIESALSNFDGDEISHVVIQKALSNMVEQVDAENEDDNVVIRNVKKAFKNSSFCSNFQDGPIRGLLLASNEEIANASTIKGYLNRCKEKSLEKALIISMHALTQSAPGSKNLTEAFDFVEAWASGSLPPVTFLPRPKKRGKD